MSTFRKLAAFAAILMIGSLGLTACGSDYGDGDSNSAPATNEAPAQSQGNTGRYGSQPDSAGEDVPDAPDDAISERPGGPNSKGDKSDSPRKSSKKDSVGDDMNVEPAPVNPVPPY